MKTALAATLIALVSTLSIPAIAADGHESTLRQALGSDWKGRLSPLLYLVGIAATVFNARLGQAFYTRVALLWLIPERRIEHELQH